MRHPAAAIIRKISDGQHTGQYLLVFLFNDKAKAGQLLARYETTILDSYKRVEAIDLRKNNPYALCVRFVPQVELVRVQKSAVGIANTLGVLAVTTTVAPDSETGLEDLSELLDDVTAKATEFIDDMSAKIKDGLNEFGAFFRQLGDSVRPPNKQD